MSRKLTTPNPGKNVELVEMQNGTPLWNTVWQFLTKLNIILLCNAAITLLGICQKELKPNVYTKTCTLMFIEALFINAKT